LLPVAFTISLSFSFMHPVLLFPVLKHYSTLM
jgi:hypothetical protein